MSLDEKSAAAPLEAGLEGQAATVVTDALTAPAVGSGTIAVYATPSLAALMEQAAVACVEPRLPAGQATLGVRLEISHTAPTLPGDTVSARATLIAIDGRRLEFAIEARDSREVIGTARHTRVIVDRARFEAKVAAKR